MMGLYLRPEQKHKPLCKIVPLLSMKKGTFTREEAREAFYDFIEKHSCARLDSEAEDLWVPKDYELRQPSRTAAYWLKCVREGTVQIACWGLEKETVQGDGRFVYVASIALHNFVDLFYRTLPGLREGVGKGSLVSTRALQRATGLYSLVRDSFNSNSEYAIKLIEEGDSTLDLNYYSTYHLENIGRKITSLDELLNP